MRCRWFAVLVLSILGPAAGGASPYVFVVSPAADSVSVLDAVNDSVVRTFALDGVVSACAMGLAGDTAFVARAQAGSVAVVDRSAGVVRVIPVGARPSGLAVLGDDRRLYVTNAGDDTVSVVDTGAGTVVATIPVGDEPMAVAAGQGRVYVANWGGGTVSVIDAAAGAVVGTVAVGTFPSGVVLAPGANRLYVANFLDDTVTVVDTAALSVVATIPVGRGPRGLAVDEPAGRLYVAAFEADRIDVVDIASNVVVLQAPSGGTNPLDVESYPATRRLYVAHLAAGGNVAVLDADTLAPVESIAVPTGPVALARQDSTPAAGFPGEPATAGDETAPPPPPFPIRGGGTVVYSDTEFNLADWTAGGAGSHFELQATAGGNPGAWRRMLQFPAPFENDVVHRLVRPGAEYDPTAVGAITGIDVSWDRRIVLASANSGVLVFEGFLVEQNGIVYRTVADAFTSLPWEAVSRANLTAASFDDGSGGQPDFSATGGVLRFGYYRRTPANQGGEHGIDNFSVSVRTGAGAPGQVGFAVTTDAVLSGDVVPIRLVRSAGFIGAVGVTVLITHPDGMTETHDLSWASGDSAPKDVFVLFFLPGGTGVRTARLALVNPTGGAVLQASRDRMAMAVAPASWPPELRAFLVFVQALLAAVSPASLPAFALLSALVAAWRRARPRAEPTR